MSIDKAEFRMAFNPIRQPDDIACGPTCLVTLVRGLTILYGGVLTHEVEPGNPVVGYGPDIMAVGRVMGTDARHGTSIAKMATGLRLFGLPVVRSAASSVDRVSLDPWSDLEKTIIEGNAVLLRIAGEGRWKRWVLLCGTAENGLFLIDPSSGAMVSFEENQQLRSQIIINAWNAAWI